MLTTTDMLILSQAAQQWLQREDLVPLEWSELPGFPDRMLPVWIVKEDPTLLTVLPDPNTRARAYRMRHDPDEESTWAFVPGPENAVWLVNTKRIHRPTPAN